jgi:hypothetical protein
VVEALKCSIQQMLAEVRTNTARNGVHGERRKKQVGIRSGQEVRSKPLFYRNRVATTRLEKWDV